MNRLFKYAMFFTAFIPLWITILFLDIMSITDETNNYIGSIMAQLSRQKFDVFIMN